MSVVLWIVGIFVLIRGAQLASLLRTVLAMRGRPGPWHTVDESEVPEHARVVLEMATQPWIELGYEPVAWVSGGCTLTLPPWHAPVHRVLHRTGTGTWLWLRISDGPEPGNETSAWSITDARDGARVETVDAPGAVPWLSHPHTATVRMANGSTPTELTEGHERACAALDAIVDEDVATHVERANVSGAAALEMNLAARELRHTSDGRVEPTMRAALRVSLRALAESGRASRQRARRKLLLGGRPREIPLELELEAWSRQDALRAMHTRRELAIGVLAVTGVLFALSLIGDFDPTQLVLLTGVVLVHELGHWLAMRARGYHDARIFFVPFLGGATIGHKDRLSLADEMIVLLAGPVPGITAGLAIVFVDALSPLPEIATEIAILLIAVNGLNLLPLFPLDGGRIVHRLIAQGRPWAEIAFRTLGLVGIAAGALLLETPIMLVLPVIMLLGMRAQWATATLERSLRDAGLPEEASERRRSIAVRLRAALPGSPIAVRIMRARELASRLDAPHASLVSRGSWLLAYGLCVAGPVLALAGVVATRFAFPRPDTDGFERVDCAAPRVPVVPDGLVQITIAPEWDDGAAETRTIDRLELYALVGPTACMPVPWSATQALSPEREAGALHTLRAMSEATHAYWAAQAPLDDGSDDHAEAELRMQRLDGALRSAIVARAGDPAFDPAIATALVERDRARREGRTDADDAFAAALGVPPSCDDQERPILIVDAAISMVTLRGTQDLGGLASYLCAGGMRDAWVRADAAGSDGARQPID